MKLVFYVVVLFSITSCKDKSKTEHKNEPINNTLDSVTTIDESDLITLDKLDALHNEHSTIVDGTYTDRSILCDIIQDLGFDFYRTNKDASLEKNLIHVLQQDDGSLILPCYDANNSREILRFNINFNDLHEPLRPPTVQLYHKVLSEFYIENINISENTTNIEFTIKPIISDRDGYMIDNWSEVQLCKIIHYTKGDIYLVKINSKLYVSKDYVSKHNLNSIDCN